MTTSDKDRAVKFAQYIVDTGLCVDTAPVREFAKHYCSCCDSDFVNDFQGHNTRQENLDSIMHTDDCVYIEAKRFLMSVI